MAKYDALHAHLVSLEAGEWNASFDAIERLLGFPLPASARKYPAWWANQETPGHSQSQAWQNAGWHTCDLNLARGQVRFRKAAPDRPVSYTANEGGLMQQLAETARRFSGIEDEQELVNEGLRALIEREAARQLARLGGSMPGFVAAPRQAGE